MATEPKTRYTYDDLASFPAARRSDVLGVDQRDAGGVAVHDP
jgi:hypothetical protein